MTSFESQNPEKPKPEPSALAEFGDSLMKSAIENPLNSLSQIGSAIIDKKLPEMHCFDPQAPTTGTSKFAEQAGNIIGMALPFLMSKGAVSWSEARLGIVASGTALSIAAEQAAIGGFMGLALTPSDQGLMGRLKNGTVDAGTFAAMGGASAKLQSSFAFTGELPLASRIMKSSLIGITSGAGGGAANAELNAVVNKGEWVATAEEFRNDAVGFAALGGIFGAVDALHAPKAAAPREASYPADPVVTANGAVAGDRPVGENQAEGPYKKPETVDPRPAIDGNRERLAAEWGELTPRELQASHLLVQHDLADFKVVSPEGKPESVLDVWNEMEARGVVTPEVRTQVMKVNALIREHFTSLVDDGHILPDQAAGWTHTMGEQARVLQAAEAAHLTPEQTKLALISSAYSDAAKYTETAVTHVNFHWHHLDGALSATLSDLGLNADELNLVTSAIKAHQIAPPEFMAKLYYMRANGMKNMLNSKMSSSVLPLGNQLRLEVDRMYTPEEQSRIKELLDPETSPYIGKSKDGMPTFKFIAEAMKREAEPTTDGGFALKLNSDEQLLLRFSGLQNVPRDGKLVLVENLDKWYVPHDATVDAGFSKLPAVEQERLVDLNKITNALLAGDNAQYATIDGAYKYVQIRGPGTVFKDGTVFDSITSIRQSYDDAYTILDPTARHLNDLHLAQTTSAYEPGGAIRQKLDAAIEKEFGTTDVAFYGRKLTLDEYPASSPGRQHQLGLLAAKLGNKDLTVADRAGIYSEAQAVSGLSEPATRDFLDAIRVKTIAARVMREAASMDPANASDDFPPARKPANSAIAPFSFEALDWQMKSTGITEQRIAASVNSDNLKGRGGNATFYKIDGLSDFGLRVPGKPGAPVDFTGPIEPVDDIFPEGNIGQPVARLGNATILKMQEGIPAGGPLGKDARAMGAEAARNIYSENVIRAASMPQSAYDEFAKTLLLLDEKKLSFDPSKANNVLIDKPNERFNVVDINSRDPRSQYNHSLSDMIITLMDNGFINTLDDRGAPWIDSYQTIISRSIAAAEKAGLPINLDGSSLQYSFRLAEMNSVWKQLAVSQGRLDAADLPPLTR